MWKIAVRVSLMRPREASGGLRRARGARGGGARLTPSRPPGAKSPGTRAGGEGWDRAVAPARRGHRLGSEQRGPGLLGGRKREAAGTRTRSEPGATGLPSGQRRGLDPGWRLWPRPLPPPCPGLWPRPASRCPAEALAAPAGAQRCPPRGPARRCRVGSSGVWEGGLETQEARRENTNYRMREGS